MTCKSDTETALEDNKEVLKIERIGSNGWYIVYEKEEKKGLLTEDEQEFLKKIIESYNQMFKTRIYKIHYYSSKKAILMDENKEYEIEIEGFKKLDIGTYRTLSELRIGGINGIK